MTRSRLICVLLASVMVVSLVAGCGSGTSTDSKQPIKIAVVFPMTGDSGSYGVSCKRSFDLAFGEINGAGGVNGRPIEVTYQDDTGDPKQSVAAAQKFVDDKEYMVLVGAGLSSCTLAVIPITQKAGMPQITHSSSSPKLSGISPYFWRMGSIDEEIGKMMANYLFKTKGYKKVASAYINTDYGKLVDQIFCAEVKALGGEITSSNAYATNERDYSGLVTKIKSENAEAIGLGSTFTDGALFVKQARDNGLNIEVASTPSINNPKYIELGGAAVEGTVSFACFLNDSPDPKVQEYVKKFKDKYGLLPDNFAGVAYDEAYVLADAFKRAMAKGPLTRESIKTAINETNLKGVSGTVTFTNKNDWIRPYYPTIVKGGAFVAYQIK